MVLAIDFGGTKTAFAHVDENGQVRGHTTLPAARTLAESVEQVAGAAREADRVGVIVPGIFTPATGEAWCPNLWGPNPVPLLRELERRLSVPVVVDSDRSGYVLGEAWQGAARGLRHVVFVSIGTGIGVGILSDGRVVRGAGGVAGAAGWFALGPDWQDHYGQTGCWEAEAAGPGVARLAGVADGQAVVAAAHEGETKARSVLDAAARYTGRGVANLISALNPEMVILGGGLMLGAADLLLAPIREEARRWAQPIAMSNCRIEMTRLGEMAGLLGAARLALQASWFCRSRS